MTDDSDDRVFKVLNKTRNIATLMMVENRYSYSILASVCA